MSLQPLTPPRRDPPMARQDDPLPSPSPDSEMSPRTSLDDPPRKPLSPPASLVSFSRPTTADPSPANTPIPTATTTTTPHFPFPFPDGRRNMAISSSSRGSSIYGSSSRPGTSGHHSRGSSSGGVGVGLRLREGFACPPTRPIMITTTTTNSSLPTVKVKRDRMRSTMLSESTESGPGETRKKPWLDSDHTRTRSDRLSYWITYAVMMLGVVAAAVRCYIGYRNVPLIEGNLCLVMDEQFMGSEESTFGRDGRWLREVQMDGYGNGEFEMTTSSSTNSFLRNGNLYIAPTLTSDEIGIDAVFNNHTYNLTECTYNITRETYPSSTTTVGYEKEDPEAYYRACGAVSNASVGAVINPVKSARLSTRRSASIRYGKVEVRAKLPTGDWMWPAIWMLPVENRYGPWPLSGEIDIMESRGNNPRYPNQGQNYVRGSLNWGPLTWLNQVSKTYGYWSERRGSYANKFHVYTLEWTEHFIRIYVDTRLHYLLDIRFNIPFFQRGRFPAVAKNGSDFVALQNPWVNGSNAAPFDQKFYLILDVAVGATSGWFPDDVGNKPWLDGSLTAMRDFAKAKDQWYQTWPQNVEDRAMIIDYVKMWQLC